jgi:hypothetical protein
LIEAFDVLANREQRNSSIGHCIGSTFSAIAQLHGVTGRIVIAGVVGLPKSGPDIFSNRKGDGLSSLKLPSDGSGQKYHQRRLL